MRLDRIDGALARPRHDHGWTIQLGNKCRYIALYATGEPVTVRFERGAPLHRIGIMVDDLQAA